MHSLQKLNEGKEKIAMDRPAALPSMSLRARETQSLALKHIFDQQMGGHRSMKSQFLQSQEVDTSFLSASHVNRLTAADQSLPQAATIPRHSNENRGQLTIFYSGNVNVYDDVPADKAHAIMVLAGDSDSVRSPIQTVEKDKERATPPLMSSSPTTNPKAPNGVSSSDATPTKPPLGLSVSSTSVTNPVPEAKPQTVAAVRRPQAGIELPYARKASLARFLEKRKDRAQEKQQEYEEEAEKKLCKEGEGDACNAAAGSSSSIHKNKKQCIEASTSGIAISSDKL